MRRSLILVLVLSSLFAALFAGAGAGIYGTPFAPLPPGMPSRANDLERQASALERVPIKFRHPHDVEDLRRRARQARDLERLEMATRRAHDKELLLLALTILVGPLACGMALANHRKSPVFACLWLLLGAVAGALLGGTTRFGIVWEWVFLVAVWLPMVLVAIGIGVRRRRA
jgi:hypothetical protein